MEDTHSYNVKISRLEDEIARFDAVLDHILKLMPEDLKVYDRIVEARDAAFRLQSQMHDCEITEFCNSGMDEAVYQNTLNEMFWDRAKQDLYDNEQDETLKGKEDEF
jgi:hypothetical protein